MLMGESNFAVTQLCCKTCSNSVCMQFVQLKVKLWRNGNIDTRKGNAAKCRREKKISLIIVKNNYTSFFLHPVIDIVNRRLISIKPPKFIHRMPRTVADLTHWKASELKCFFNYSISIFEGIMRADYFEHYLRLIIAITILSSDEITDSMIQISQDLLSI